MVNANDDLAALISNDTMRFGAFAALSMHNATAAALELRRTVAQYGFLGALVNDYQQSGADNGALAISIFSMDSLLIACLKLRYCITINQSTTSSGKQQ
jgi:predicted TIM-barrel fold metal-dependent hydrolase